MKVLYIVLQNLIHETEMIIGLKRLGIEAYVVTGKRQEPNSSKLESAGIPVECVPFNSRIDRAAVRNLRNVLLKFKPDIVHAFNNKTISNALLACRGIPVRFITYRGVVGNVSFLNPGSWMTHLHPRVDRIICVADAIRNYLLDLRFLRLKIPPHKIVTIYKGHDLDWYRAQPKNLAEFGISEDDFIVSCVANYRPRKGIEKIIEAAELLQDTNIHFLLIGNMQNKKLLSLLAQSPARGRIHLAGYRKDAPQLQAACDACILPSLEREGLPRSVIEGMAYGLPAIVTDAGGSAELVEQGVSGLIIPPGSAQAIAAAVMGLKSDPEKCERMGAAARKRIESHFNIHTTVEKTFALYLELAAKPG